MNLSPKLREIQQSKAVQTFLVPALITGMVTAIGAILASSHGDLSTLDWGEIKTALGVGGFGALTYIAGIWQHGVGSASFHADGSENKLVTKIAEETQMIPGTAAQGLDVKVVPK